MADIIITSTESAAMDNNVFMLQTHPDDALTPLVYTGEDFRELLDAVFPTAGVLQGGMAVTQNGAGDNSVNIAPGYAILPAMYTNGGKYLVRIRTALNIGVPTAPPSGTDIHRLVLEVLDKADGGASEYGFQARVMEDTGTPPTTPVNGAISLATITRTSAAPNVLQAAITDTRPYADNKRSSQVVNAYNAYYDVSALDSAPITIPGLSLSVVAREGDVIRVAFHTQYDPSASEKANIPDTVSVGSPNSQETTTTHTHNAHTHDIGVTNGRIATLTLKRQINGGAMFPLRTTTMAFWLRTANFEFYETAEQSGTYTYTMQVGMDSLTGNVAQSDLTVSLVV